MFASSNTEDNSHRIVLLNKCTLSPTNLQFLLAFIILNFQEHEVNQWLLDMMFVWTVMTRDALS